MLKDEYEKIKPYLEEFNKKDFSEIRINIDKELKEINELLNYSVSGLISTKTLIMNTTEENDKWKVALFLKKEGLFKTSHYCHNSVKCSEMNYLKNEEVQKSILKIAKRNKQKFEAVIPIIKQIDLDDKQLEVSLTLEKPIFVKEDYQTKQEVANTITKKRENYHLFNIENINIRENTYDIFHLMMIEQIIPEIRQLLNLYEEAQKQKLKELTETKTKLKEALAQFLIIEAI